mgnify:CR=1 FL=1
MSETENMHAFPSPDGYHYGMTLRDYFAGQALAGYLANPISDDVSMNGTSADCYRIADVMLAERAKGGEA